jgi:hypothetical protein
VRHRLTGYGPTAKQRRLIRRGVIRGGDNAPSAGQMRSRAAAVDVSLSEDDRESGEVNRNGS